MTSAVRLPRLDRMNSHSQAAVISMASQVDAGPAQVSAGRLDRAVVAHKER